MNQVPGLYRRRVGPFVVTAVSDGHIDAPLAVLANIAPEEAGALLDRRFTGPTPRLSVQAYLVQGQGQTILIDTGAGTLMGPSCGHVIPNLAVAGVLPSQIDLVLLTHFHGDHSGGLTTPTGDAAFPRAELAYPAEEGAFWFDDAAMRAAPEERRPAFLAARTAAAPYRTRAISGQDAAPGITRLPLPGHTPGHSGYHLGDGPDALLIWGDIMHVPDVQSARPDACVIYDLDPAQAAATRRTILATAADERLAVAGMHLHFPGFCHVARTADAYELIPEPWLPVL